MQDPRTEGNRPRLRDGNNLTAVGVVLYPLLHFEERHCLPNRFREGRIHSRTLLAASLKEGSSLVRSSAAARRSVV